MTALRPAPTRIDPLGPGGSGIYEDSRVVVERLDLGSAIDAVARADGRVHVRHCLDPMAVDDGIAEPLAGVLAAVTGDHATFCSAFTGIVVTSHVDPVRAWERFYRNSLRSIDDVTRSGYVEVYRHAVGLLGDARLYDHVLDLGCGFGFLALHLSRLGMRVTAADVDAGVVACSAA